MGRFLFLSLLCVVSSSAFALFPVQTDWQVNHLQGKVKSVVYHAEDNPETVDGKMMTTDTARFYNEQGFLIKTEVNVGESKSADKITAIYRYDKQHRLKEVDYGMDKDTYGQLYHYEENADGSGAILEISYIGKKPKKPNFQEEYVKRTYDKEGKLTSEAFYSAKDMIDGHVRKFHYDNGKLIKACDFDDVGKERNCDTCRYLEDGTFEHNTNFNVGRANFTYDKNHNELKHQIFDEYERLKETLTIRHKFDKYGNVVESIMYDEKGQWLGKETYTYEYYK